MVSAVHLNRNLKRIMREVMGIADIKKKIECVVRLRVRIGERLIGVLQCQRLLVRRWMIMLRNYQSGLKVLRMNKQIKQWDEFDVADKVQCEKKLIDRKQEAKVQLDSCKEFILFTIPETQSIKGKTKVSVVGGISKNLVLAVIKECIFLLHRIKIANTRLNGDRSGS